MPTGPLIAAKLPDLPRWVEVRDLLLSEEGEISGFQEEPRLSFVLRETDGDSLFVIGAPAAATVRAEVQGLGRGGQVIAPSEAAPWLIQILSGWTFSRIVIHTLRDAPCVPPGAARFLDPRTLDRLPIDPELLEELRRGASHSPIAAAFVDQQPVSFCYAGAETESLWDIAIDTLPEHRRRGHAAQCAAHMIRHMQAQGKQPVWQAVETNPASWRLAHKLGFGPIDELTLFTRPAQ